MNLLTIVAMQGQHFGPFFIANTKEFTVELNELT